MENYVLPGGFFLSFIDIYYYYYSHHYHHYCYYIIQNVSAPAEASSCGVSLLSGPVQLGWVVVWGTALPWGAL